MAARRFELAVSAPFRLDLTVWALRRRSHNAVDRFDGGCYRRTLVVDGRVVEVAVRQSAGGSRPRLGVEVRCPGPRPSAHDTAEVRRVLRRTLGTEVDMAGFYHLARRDRRLTALAERFSGMRPPRFPSVFEALVNAIACQQLSLTVGIHLVNRLAQRFGPTVGTGGEVGEPPGFPRPGRLADADPEEVRSLGFSRSKARAICELAGKVDIGEVDLEALESADDDTACSALLNLRGVGRWSAEYTLLRGLGRLQTLPGDDVAARKSLQKRFGLPSSSGYETLSALSRSWWPYGGLVYLHLLLDGLAAAGM